jgi:hypothetical protein
MLTKAAPREYQYGYMNWYSEYTLSNAKYCLFSYDKEDCPNAKKERNVKANLLHIKENESMKLNQLLQTLEDFLKLLREALKQFQNIVSSNVNRTTITQPIAYIYICDMCIADVGDLSLDRIIGNDSQNLLLNYQLLEKNVLQCIKIIQNLDPNNKKKLFFNYLDTTKESSEKESLFKSFVNLGRYKLFNVIVRPNSKTSECTLINYPFDKLDVFYIKRFQFLM